METAGHKEKDIYGLLNVIKSHDGHSNLLEHLMKLYDVKAEINNNTKFLDLLEDISLRIKTHGGYSNESKVRESLLNYLQEFEKNSKNKKALLGPLVKKNPEGGDPEVISQVNFVPEYHNIFQTLEWVGISIGEKESYLLTNSLRSLVMSKGLPGGVTFWGKIYGKEKDYFIAEALGVEASSENPITDPDYEKRNEDGVNKNTYYVTNDLTGDWVELADVKPAHIRMSRKIRYIFTGDLSRKITTNPHFPGEERELLRCQIARISHGSKIEPSINHWTVPDPENPFKAMEKNPDESKVKPMKLNDCLSLSNWIHFPPVILDQGRVSHYIEYPEEVNQEEYKAKIVLKDPFGSRIKPITDDKALVSSIPNIKLPAWKIQYVYEDKIYTNPNIKVADKSENPDEEAKDNTTNYVVICIRCLRWPGAYTIKSKNDNYSFYFGWGQKFADYTMGEQFVYQDFPVLPKDIKDFDDFPEPNSPPHEEAGDEPKIKGDDE